MRLICLLGLAACYQPNAATPCAIECTTSCPPGLTCQNNRCVAPNGTCPADAPMLDATESDVDAENQTQCTPTGSAGSESVVLNNGTWFVAAPAYAVVYKLEGVGSDIRTVRGTNGAITNPLYSLIIQDSAVDFVYAPRLSPGGSELFLRIEPQGGSAPYIGRMTRSTGNAWSGVVAQTIATHAITSDDPSPPTTTSPRRMLLSQSITFIELQETGADTWTPLQAQVPSFTLGDATPVAFLGQAHLSTSGLRMVFRGQVSGQLIGAFYVDRTSLGEPFASPARQLVTSTSAHTPYFTSDCKVLFYSTASDVVMRVAY